MANSKYEYVRMFEEEDSLLPNTWIVIRVDGRGFHKLSKKYAFEKPNDKRALDLMNRAATAVVSEISECVIAYGFSDEYSFVLHKTCTLFERRKSKLISTIVSTFTSYFAHLWPTYFPDTPLSPPLPSFDARAVLYPTDRNLRDYLSWRQVDCHINNLYNTTFWALIQQGGMEAKDAEKELMVKSNGYLNLLRKELTAEKGSYAADKNEIMFSRFGINYNNEPEMFKKGSVVLRDYRLAEPGQAPALLDELDEEDTDLGAPVEQSKTQQEKERRKKAKARITVLHVDIIRDEFWAQRPWILLGKAGAVLAEPLKEV